MCEPIVVNDIQGEPGGLQAFPATIRLAISTEGLLLGDQIAKIDIDHTRAFASCAEFQLPSAASEDCLPPPLSARAFADKTTSPAVMKQVTSARIPTPVQFTLPNLKSHNMSEQNPSRAGFRIAGLTASCVHFEVRVSP
jgi:hypothetical protein